MTAVGKVIRYRLQGRSEGGGSWGARDPPPLPPLVDFLFLKWTTYNI